MNDVHRPASDAAPASGSGADPAPASGPGAGLTSGAGAGPASGPSADTPPVTRTVVLDQTLPAPRTTQRVEVRRITIAPNVPSGLHIHNGPVFGSIETGSAVLQVEDGPQRTLTSGDVFYEPEAVGITRFDAGPEGVTFLAYFPLAPGESSEITFP